MVEVLRLKFGYNVHISRKVLVIVTFNVTFHDIAFHMDCYISLVSSKIDKMHALRVNPDTKKLQVVQYYNDPNFKFTVTNNLIIHKKTGMVLDALGGAIEGAQIGIWNINSCPNQEWFFNEDKTIRSSNGLCINYEKKQDLFNSSGQNLILSKFNSNTPKWRLVSIINSE